MKRNKQHIPAFRAIQRVFPALLLVLICLIPHSIEAQTDSDLKRLRNKKLQLERDIKNLSVARDSARAKKDVSFSELQLLNRQLYLREQLLKTMNRQVKALIKEIERTQSTITALEADIEKIKAEFGRLMVVTYKALHNKSTAFYIFSSESLSQGMKRVQYFRAISRMQQSQMKLIRRTKAFLARKKVELEEQKEEKKALAVQQKVEQQTMLALKEEQKVLFKQLQADEKKLEADIQDTKSALVALNEEIAKVIKAIAAKRTKTTKTAKERDIINKLNGNFVSNKGKFPWPMPMPNATVTRKFGRQTIPGSNAVVELQGIDILTLPGQAVRSVFKGKVETVMPVIGQGRMVIVSHGDYFTVYANLADVVVTAGEEIDMLATIGTARTDNSSGETKIHFQLYKEREPQNPESWLVRKN